MISPGIYPDMSIDEYHGHDDVISKSGLDKVDKSLDHFIAYQNDEFERTSAMAFGSAVHDAVLEPSVFEIDYKRLDGKGFSSRRTKTYKEWERSNPGVTGLMADEYDEILAIRDAVLNHPRAAAIFSKGRAEVSHFWKDRDTGVMCRCRPDWTTGNVLVDLKTTQDASEREFQRAIWNYRYHVQAAFYLDGCEAASGDTFDHFVFIAVEKSAPYSVAIYELDTEAIHRGRDDYRKNLRAYADWRAGLIDWTGYPTEITKISLPAWA